MAKKSQVKEYICLGNISLKGESGVKYVKDQYYTAEEVRLSPADKKHKFVKLETISPEAIDGTNAELKALIQRQQIKIQTLEAALAQYEGAKPDPVQSQGSAITSKTGGQQPAKKL